MTIKEAAKLVKRDIRTIQRWEKAGVDIADPKALLAHAEVMDCKARGSSKGRVRARLDAVDEEQPDPAILTPEDREVLAASHPETFVDLPAPFTNDQYCSAVKVLAILRGAFQRRLNDLRTTGHALVDRTGGSGIGGNCQGRAPDKRV